MKKALPYISAFTAGLLLLLIPLLRDLHFESALLASLIGFTWAGLTTLRKNTRSDFFQVIRISSFLFTASLPLFINALLQSCLTADGIGYWLLGPLPSVLLGAAIGRVIRKFHLPIPKILFLCILLATSLGIWLFEVFNFPQVFFYNHIWGAWPGPIYDEAVNLSLSYFYFRGITLLWVVLLWILPDWDRSKKNKLISALSFLALCFSYMNLSEMNIVWPAEDIQEILGAHESTNHFDIYYDPGYFSYEEINYWKLKHEWYFEEITKVLNIDWPENRKIESYLYPHAWAKKSITGAKFTSYVPIWLEKDQLHIARQQLDGVLKHEMVHVLSKQFGNKWFNGSWSIGLIEGLAEALACDASSRSTLDQIVASEKPLPDAESMENALSLSGFYSSAGAISYTTAGSFVKFLLENYPVEYFKKAYASSKLEEAYSKDFDELVRGWHEHLRSTPVDRVDQRVSELIFAQKSLFQKDCPHAVSPELRLWDRYRYLLADKDTAAAYSSLNELYKLNSSNALVHVEWVKSRLKTGHIDAAITSFNSTDTLLLQQILLADAFMLKGHYASADSILKAAAPQIRASTDPSFDASLALRESEYQWKHHVNRRYNRHFPDSLEFNRLNLSNKTLSTSRALEAGKDSLFIKYSTWLESYSPRIHFFDFYIHQIDRLVFLGTHELASQWISRVSSMNLRPRYEQRLQSVNRWYLFNNSLSP